jgi:hypothetical protein
MAISSGPVELTHLLTARRGWFRKHAVVALSCSGAAVVLASLMVLGIRKGFASGHPGAVVFDAALIGVLVSLAAGASANAWSAWRFGSRIPADAVAVGCRVRRLAPETRMRKDYLQVTVGERTVLVRCAEDAPTSAMAESIEAGVLGWPAKRGGIVLVLPHLGLMAATVGRYHRHLPRALRAQPAGGRAATSD